MKPRTICIMGRLLDQDDGLGVYSSNLLRRLFDLDRHSRYLVLLRSDKCARQFESYPNVRTRVIPSRSKLWWDQVVVPIAARRAGADIIFNPKFSLPLLSRIPGVFVLHGSDWYVNPGNYTRWDNIYIRIMMPVYCRKARRLLSISNVVVDDLARYAHLDRSKVTVSYAAPAAHFKPVEDRKLLREFSERFLLPDRFMLTVGRVYHTGSDQPVEYPGGNNESLIRAYRRYRSAGGKLDLVVAGKDINRYLQMRGFADRDLEGVHFTGFIPNTEMVKAYNLAQFIVLATLYESFCLPLIEAMACGCPAIVPNTGGCPEIAQGAARLINPLDIPSIADGMLALERSEDLRNRMSAAGLERVKMFSWNQTAQKTIDVFDAIIPGNGRPDGF
jgi:glycosyltransferase involved in cell wall biosynthesis